MTNHKSTDEVAIKVSKVSKTFRLPHERQTSIKGLFVNMLRRKKTYEEQRVLKDISFDIKKGEFFGIVGRNGSGKSTLLKLLAGIYTPNSGTVEVKGKLTPFIELGVGFNPELTGRENVFLNGALLGFNRNEMLVMYNDIVAFAELESFMDQKLKNYSSGMQVRLAFSIAIRARTDILLLDEVLAVGDAAFQKKCFDYFRKLKKDKSTVVFISHDMNAVREYCDRALMLESGEIVVEGEPEKVAQRYTRLFSEETIEQKTNDDGKRWGTGRAKISAIEVDGKGKSVVIRVGYVFHDSIDDPIFGLSITNPVGIKVFESNTKWQRAKTGTFRPKDKVEIIWTIPNIFTNGDNLVTPAVADKDVAEFFDHWEDAAVLKIDKDGITTAVTLPDSSVKITRS